MKKKAIVVLLIALIVSSMAFATGAKETATGSDQPYKIGVLYISPPGDMGYSYMHDQGTKAAEAYFGDKIKVTRMESVSEDENSLRVMENLIGEGCEMIIGTSYGFMDYMYQLAEEYPEVKFEHASGYKSSDNMNNYFGRMYQMRYLSGMIAGAMTKSNKIGYVGAFSIPEVIRGIDAFALGVKETNPKATVYVVFTNTWFDPALERQGATALLDMGCDIIAQHQDTTEPAKAAIERGGYAVGYNADFGTILGSDKVLVSPMWNWGNYLIPTIQKALDGTWTGNNAYWGGLEDEMIKLSPISPLVPEAVQKQVATKLQQMHDGTFDVFWGEIKDNKGNIVQKAGEKMSDADMLSIQFFVDNVNGTF